MVKQGPFSAELVYADTKIPFQEHTSSSGQIFVEVEPDAEYFIRVKSEHPRRVRIAFSVDGEDLGYCQNQHRANAQDCGLWSYDGENSVMKALVFVKTPVRPKSDGGEAPPYWTGEIEVKFYESIESGTYQKQAHTNAWSGGDVGYQIGAGDPSKKKGLKSTKGEYKEAKTVKAGIHKRYKKGQLIDTITLKYCSTIGLIHAGILPKPPAWELHRMQFPAGPPTQTADMNVDLTSED